MTSNVIATLVLSIARSRALGLGALLCLCPGTEAACPATAPGDTGIGTFRTLVIGAAGFESDPVYGSKNTFVYVPSTYQAAQGAPLFVLLHGTAGSPTLAIGQASIMRNVWAGAAEAGGFIIAAPVASGVQGGWIAPISETDTPSDYDVVLAVIRRLSRDYRIDASRIYLWGFSSGGHVTLDIALNRTHRQLNSELFAGFGAHAGVSAGLACSGLNAVECASMVFAPGTSKRPLDLHIGQTDPLWPRALEDRGRFTSNGWIEGVTFFWHPFAGGHEVPSAHPLQIWNNLCGFRNRIPEIPQAIAVPQPFRIDSQAIPGTRTASPNAQKIGVAGLRPQDGKR
jgi:predicted esterase